MAENKVLTEISRFVNIESAKKLAFILMIGFSLYNGYLMIKYGGNSCKWLLTDGHLQGNNFWQPFGCMMHHYNHKDISTCVKYIAYWGGENRFVFIGDSRLRDLYYNFLQHISDKSVAPTNRHADHEYKDTNYNLNIRFVWDPFLNSTGEHLMKNWATGQDTSPTVILMAAATWFIKQANGSISGIREYEDNLSQISKYFRRINKSRIIWMLQESVSDDLMWPNRSAITNQMIDKYNEASEKILNSQKIEIWSSNTLISKELSYTQSKLSDGLHLSKTTLDWDTQILLNMHCNNHIKFYDGTCCSVPEPVSTVQIVTLVCFIVCCSTAMVCYIIDSFFLISTKNRRSTKPFIQTHHRVGSDSSVEDGSLFCTVYELSWAFSKLGFILAYFFVCDRTIFFMKENKSFTIISFIIPLLYIFIVGIFFSENSQMTGMLHRDLTDEWKGWMQLVILIYHITGASKVLPIYMLIRVLVSAYLFLSGYGHFTYFWCKGSGGVVRFSQSWVRSFNTAWTCRRSPLRRFCEVMFRMNLLVVSLCFVMNRPYQFYYFVPLVSFWYLVIFLTMSLWPRVSAETVESKKANCVWMVVKLTIVAVLITVLYASEYVFDKIFLTNPLRSLFVSSEDNPHEWRFRWKLDRYSTLYGMVFAFIYHLAKQNRFLVDNHQGNLFSTPVSFILTGLGVVGLLGYGVFSLLCPGKEECNETHSYLTVLPIMSYVLVRSCFGTIRQRFSTFFAWFGKISLELFIGQYHIWMAADTHGVLVLIPGNPVINVVLTSFVFVCIAHEIRRITCLLLPVFVPDDWRLVVRNIFLFMVILLPIAVSHGVFNF